MNVETDRLYWDRVNKYLPVLQVVPGLRLVAICNNLAFGKVNFESDIDLFIVAKRGRLFTVRFLVTTILHLMGVRRYADKVAGRFCLSFFVDDSSLDLSSVSIEDDVYLSYWLKTMLPVIDDGVSVEIANANKWVEDFFSEQKIVISRKKVFERSLFLSLVKFIYKWTVDLLLGSFIEFILRSWQLKRAKKKAEKASKAASLIVDEHVLKFHNIDRRAMYRDQWRRRFGSEKLSEEKFLSLR